MSNESIENSTPASEAEQPKAKGKPAKKAKPAKKPAPAKKNKPKAERANKKAEVIALMRRAKGATLVLIMKATGWQAHTVRGFVSILGKKGSESSKRTDDERSERSYKIK